MVLRRVTCCVVLCCAVVQGILLRYAALSYVVICFMVLYCSVLCYIVLCLAGIVLGAFFFTMKPVDVDSSLGLRAQIRQQYKSFIPDVAATAKNFAKIGGLYSLFECAVDKVRCTETIGFHEQTTLPLSRDLASVFCRRPVGGISLSLFACLLPTLSSLFSCSLVVAAWPCHSSCFTGLAVRCIVSRLTQARATHDLRGAIYGGCLTGAALAVRGKYFDSLGHQLEYLKWALLNLNTLAFLKWH